MQPATKTEGRRMKPTKYMRYARKHMGIKPVKLPTDPVERAAEVARVLAGPVSWAARRQAT